MSASYDFIVVGGGAVGLHAALKAAVLRHTVLIVDKGAEFARVTQAPAIANIPGAPGISGKELLSRLRADLEQFQSLSGTSLIETWDGTEAVAASREPSGGFIVRSRDTRGGQEREARGRALILATGVVDSKPGISAFHEEGHETMAPFVHRGGVGYCLLCEGWDLRGRSVGVVGCSEDAASIALDVVEHFGGRVTLLTDGAPAASLERAEALAAAGVKIESHPVQAYGDKGSRVVVELSGGEERTFDKLLFSLGFYRVNNDLAVMLGADTTAEGYVRTDANSEVLDAEGEPIRGLFAVGDLRADRWKQVVIGWGDAESAVITAYAKRIPW